MTLALIWLSAALLQAAFHAWYVGFRPPLNAEEIEDCCRRLLPVWGAERVARLRLALGRDRGREFYMFNVLRILPRTADGQPGRRVFDRYQKPFLRRLLGRACHPIAVGLAAAPAVELWGLDKGEHWDLGAFVRYRSYRDLVEILLAPDLHGLHEFKEAALEKTFAFPCDPAFVVGGGPKLLVPLLLVTGASLASLLLV